jgi:hypothetical protein
VESGAPAPLPTAHHRLDDDEHLITLLHHIRGLYSTSQDVILKGKQGCLPIRRLPEGPAIS